MREHRLQVSAWNTPVAHDLDMESLAQLKVHIASGVIAVGCTGEETIRLAVWKGKRHLWVALGRSDPFVVGARLATRARHGDLHLLLAGHIGATEETVVSLHWCRGYEWWRASGQDPREDIRRTRQDRPLLAMASGCLCRRGQGG